MRFVYNFKDNPKFIQHRENVIDYLNELDKLTVKMKCKSCGHIGMIRRGNVHHFTDECRSCGDVYMGVGDRNYYEYAWSCDSSGNKYIRYWRGA